jgi:hypothetical protein
VIHDVAIVFTGEGRWIKPVEACNIFFAVATFESWVYTAPYLKKMKSANGVLILVLGILGMVMTGCLTGIPAWIMGNNALKEIDSGAADPSERNLVQIGRILGIVATCLSLLGLCVWLAAMFGLIGLAAFSGATAPR